MCGRERGREGERKKESPGVFVHSHSDLLPHVPLGEKMCVLRKTASLMKQNAFFPEKLCKNNAEKRKIACLSWYTKLESVIYDSGCVSLEHFLLSWRLLESKPT